MLILLADLQFCYQYKQNIWCKSPLSVPQTAPNQNHHSTWVLSNRDDFKKVLFALMKTPFKNFSMVQKEVGWGGYHLTIQITSSARSLVPSFLTAIRGGLGAVCWNLLTIHPINELPWKVCKTIKLYDPLHYMAMWCRWRVNQNFGFASYSTWGVLHNFERKGGGEGIIWERVKVSSPKNPTHLQLHVEGHGCIGDAPDQLSQIASTVAAPLVKLEKYKNWVIWRTFVARE